MNECKISSDCILYCIFVGNKIVVSSFALLQMKVLFLYHVYDALCDLK